MSEQQELKLHCTTDMSDFVRVFPDSAGDGLVGVRCTTAAYGAAVFLDRDDARKLFNWLGVWLHTPR